MNPIKFTKHETIFIGQSENVLPLPTKIIEYSDGKKGIISCWKPAIRERFQMLFGKPIYLVILGSQQPPVLLSLDANEIGATDKDDEKEVEILYDEKLGKVNW